MTPAPLVPKEIRVPREPPDKPVPEVTPEPRVSQETTVLMDNPDNLVKLVLSANPVRTD